MRRLSLNRSEPAKKSGHNTPKNRCRTTIAERMVETLAELPFIGDEVVCLSHDRAARSGPAGIGGWLPTAVSSPHADEAARQSPAPERPARTAATLTSKISNG